jgi:hypothetical protein
MSETPTVPAPRIEKNLSAFLRAFAPLRETNSHAKAQSSQRLRLMMFDVEPYLFFVTVTVAV